MAPASREEGECVLRRVNSVAQARRDEPSAYAKGAKMEAKAIAVGPFTMTIDLDGDLEDMFRQRVPGDSGTPSHEPCASDHDSVLDRYPVDGKADPNWASTLNPYPIECEFEYGAWPRCDTAKRESQ